MNQPNPLDDANNLAVQHFIRRYLSGPAQTVLTIEGACVVTQRIGNRHGVPHDAITYLHSIEHPDLGFRFDARSVRRCGTMMEPIAVHTTILDYEDQKGHDTAAVRLVANEWLQTVPL